MRILFLGPKENATTWQRIEALKENGHELEVVYDRIIGVKPNFFRRLIRFAFRKMGKPLEQNNENKALVDKAKTFKPDLVFISKGLTIKSSTIISIKKLNPNCAVICYSLDDIMNPGNQSKTYLKAIPYYDIHFTSKTYNIEELLDLGAKKVRFTNNSYSPLIHKPLELTTHDIEQYGCSVSFIGGYEADRAGDLLYLAENGVKIRIWGNNWHKYKVKHPNLIIEYKAAYGDIYTKVVNSSEIILGFLRKINRDTITTRSLEIPASGGFMLAERTQDHLDLFKEGVEAEYFDTREELKDKIIYYLNEPEKLKAIALAGYNKCMKLNLSYNDTMKKLIKDCFEKYN
jgi:spore maturation protein CgeB